MVNDEALVLEGKMSPMLNLMKKTFYSDKEIFLRELINNAFDALNKIRFERLADMRILDDELIIRLIPHKANKTLSIIDNGVGMTKYDLVNNLGVGFYSAYLVAHKVIVTSKYNELDQYIWESQLDGSLIFTRDINGQKIPRGTKITLFLKDDQLEYLEETIIKNLVNKHCQHITYPIYIWSENTKDNWQLINSWLHKQEMKNKLVDEKLGNHLPDDLIVSILFKLPLKSLQRFGGLCKSWTLLFENSHFIDLFRKNIISSHHSYYDDTSLVLCLTQYYNDPINYESSLFSLNGERFQNIEKINWTNPLEDHPFEKTIFSSSSVNGIVCFYLNYYNQSMYLWNPATGEVKTIPHSPIEYGTLDVQAYITNDGFGYDCVRDDYKVIRTMSFTNTSVPDMDDVVGTDWDYSPICEIYSQRSNSWRKVDMDCGFCSANGGNHLYLDGMCHWLSSWSCPFSFEFQFDFTHTDNEVYLVSFDISNETCCGTLVPIDMPIDDDFHISGMARFLFVLNGYIAIMSNYPGPTTFYISILGEVGKKESWKKLFSFDPLPGIGKAIGARSMGNILFRKADGQLVWFDLNTHKITKVGIKVHPGIYSHMVIYRESLLQIPEMNT